MERTTPIRLNDDERGCVEVFVRRGKANARMLTCARALLKSHEGWIHGKIVETLDSSEQTICNIKWSQGCAHR